MAQVDITKNGISKRGSVGILSNTNKHIKAVINKIPTIRGNKGYLPKII